MSGTKTISTWPSGEKGFMACRAVDWQSSNTPYVILENNNVLVVYGYVVDKVVDKGKNMA